MNTPNNKKTWYIVIGLLVVVFIGAVAVGTYFLQKPLGEELAVRTQATAVPLDLPTEPKPTEPPAEKPTAVKPTATTAPTATPAGICGRTDSMVLLFAGTGVSEGNSADAVRILKIDFAKPEVVVIAFPRDLWVQTPELKALEVNESLLGPSFETKRKSVTGTDKAKFEAATKFLAQTLYDNFGVVADHYITVNIEPWGEMIDTIGGVEMVLPAEVALNNGLVLPAGKQVLNGTEAREFVRSLYQATDEIRIQRQDLFVKALHDKVLTANTLTKVPQLLKDFDKAIVTDMSPAELLTLGCLAEMAPPSQISYFEVNDELVTPRSDGALLPKVPEIKAALAEELQ